MKCAAAEFKSIFGGKFKPIGETQLRIRAIYDVFTEVWVEIVFKVFVDKVCCTGAACVCSSFAQGILSTDFLPGRVKKCRTLSDLPSQSPVVTA